MSYRQCAQQLASALTAAMSTTQFAVTGAEQTVTTALTALIDALPSYGDPEWLIAHRQALTNTLAVNLVNDVIAPQPDSGALGVVSTYSYSGSFSGYRDAFYHGVTASSSGQALSTQVQSAVNSLNGQWWSQYSTAVLTDAIRLTVPMSLDTGKLSSVLSSCNSAFSPALSASCLALLQSGYSPTMTALAKLNSFGDQGQAATLLDQAIRQGHFTAAVNQSISMGGESTLAATWFLFNLWLCLKILAVPNVDAAITGYRQAGLSVPAEIGPGSWWNGGYTSWYLPLSGSDVVAMTRSTITAAMPETESTTCSGSYYPAIQSVTESNGYSLSFCNWGAQANYLPGSGSCFAKGTQVLMADGISKAIETVQIGDQVMSSAGPRAVVLVESPKRAGRALYSINQLPCYSTAAHPYRAADQQGALRYAIHPWELQEGIPTMSEQGIATLTKGIELLGRCNGEQQTVIVNSITEQSVSDDDEQCVYDLLLERWSVDHPCYYVGGPQQFIAVEAETADPSFAPAVTVAVVTALEQVRNCSHQHLQDPLREIPAILSRLDLSQISVLAQQACKIYWRGKSLHLPRLPDLSLFLQRGEWDAHSSALEYALVRYLSRWLRAEINNGWQLRVTNPPQGAELVVGLLVMELLGDRRWDCTEWQINLQPVGITFDQPTTSQMQYQWQVEKMQWFWQLDQRLELGQISNLSTNAYLHGEIWVGKQQIGHFKLALMAQSQNYVEPFIFDAQGQVIGRIGLATRYLSAVQLTTEHRQQMPWGKWQRFSLALTLGQQLGYQLCALITAHASK